MRTFKSLVGKHFPQGATLGEALKKLSSLPEQTLAEAARKGAVWLQKGKGKTLRARELSQKLSPQDTVTLFYDPRVLALPEPSGASCLFENNLYSVWFKPAGVVAQGTQTGDHASLLRVAELHRKKEVFLVHRLDRETAGLMLVAHTSEAASRLSELFQKNKIRKDYEAIVLGGIPPGNKATINASLDDKEAITHYEVIASTESRALLSLTIETGRLHQIRRHLDHIGHPVMGDPKYGKGNKNREGLLLLARRLSFTDPWEKKTVTWTSPQGLSL